MATSNSNKIVRSLQKLPENKRCFNCEVLGTNFIVPPLNIFVCTDCSGLHMKCGQRVKSISLGNYSPEEAKTLQEGGNEKASRIYLGKWSPNTGLQKPIDKKPPRVEEWIKSVFISKQFYSEEAARQAEISAPVKALSSILGSDMPKLQVHVHVEDKPLKPGAKLPLPAPAVPRPSFVPDPPPEPELAPAPTPAPAPAPAPKLDEISLLDFSNSPVKATAPADSWSAFDSAPALNTGGSQSTTEAFDPFGSFSSEPAHPAAGATAAALDPFGAPSVSATQQPTAAFDPFGNSSNSFSAAALPAAAAPAFHTSTFDPFSNPPSTSTVPRTSAGAINTAASQGAWSPFDMAPAAQAPAASNAAILASNGFGLDVFPNMPSSSQAQAPPAYGTASTRNSLSSFGEFDAFPPTQPSVSPANAQAKAPPSELPSDLFSDSAFSASAFPSAPGAQGFGMANPQGLLPANGFGPSQPGFPGAPAVPFGAAPTQPGFGMAPGSSFGMMPAGGFANPPAGHPFGAPGQMGHFSMTQSSQFGSMAPTGSAEPSGQLGGIASNQFAAGTPGHFSTLGQNSQFGGLGAAGQLGGGVGVGVGNQYGGMPAPGQFPGGMDPAAQFGGGGQAAAFGGPSQGSMGFNAFSHGGALGAPGAAPFGGPNSFSAGPNSFATTAGPAKKDDMAFADLVGDLKKALPTHTHIQSYGGQQYGAFSGATAFGNMPQAGGAAFGGPGGFGNFGAMPGQAPSASSFAAMSGNPFA